MCSILGYIGKDVSKQDIENALLKTIKRGPDVQQVVEAEFGYLGFARLAIMGLSEDGMQPFERNGNYIVCNGEIYGFRRLKKELESRGYSFVSESDCEILLPLYKEYGVDMFAHLDADAPLSFLLSGGLDSSLVCAIAANITKRPIHTFAIGMDVDAIDLKYAKKVADFIGAKHTEIIMTKQQVLDTLEEVIAALGTYDITTIRASMGMYLVCKAIHENTNIKVLLTGEISDELFGYKYTDFAPNAQAFQEEAKKRIREIHYYDVLRADRCLASNSLEARVPFGDLDFVRYVMAIEPAKKLNTYHMGKYLLRKAFEKDEILPEEILWREKAAFSDAVGHSMVDDLKEYAENYYSDEEFEERSKQYTFATPFTKESLLYREIFEKYYPGQAQMVPDFWMPNKEWEGCAVNDPSARVLTNYGNSGL